MYYCFDIITLYLLCDKHNIMTGDDSSNVSIAIYSIICFLIHLSCIGSTIASYFYFKGDINTSFHVIVIPFYIAFICYVFHPLYQMYLDVKFLKRKTKYTSSYLLCSPYSQKILYTILKRVFYSCLFFITVSLLEYRVHKQNPTKKSDNLTEFLSTLEEGLINKIISIYLLILAISFFVEALHTMIGSIWDIYFSNGSLQCELDSYEEKSDDLTIEKMVRLYLFRKPSTGVIFTYNNVKINYSHLLNPVPIALGISLIMMSNAFMSTNESLSSTMNDVMYIMYIANILYMSINAILSIVMYACFHQVITFGTIIYTYFLLILPNVYLLLLSNFYKGMFEYLYNLSLGKNTDPIFVFYIIGINIGMILSLNIQACIVCQLRNLSAKNNSITPPQTDQV